jgi:hypothetical protein
MRGPEDLSAGGKTMPWNLTRKQLTAAMEKRGRSRDLDEIVRERLDDIAAFAMVSLVIAYATYAFVL